MLEMEDFLYVAHGCIVNSNGASLPISRPEKILEERMWIHQ